MFDLQWRARYISVQSTDVKIESLVWHQPLDEESMIGRYDLRVAFWHSSFPPYRTLQRRRQVEIYPSAAGSVPDGRLCRIRAPE